ncbi:MAG TPA: CDP-diacylglycerol--serine O-phosphatidyltransferase [Bacilli bacterium]
MIAKSLPSLFTVANLVLGVIAIILTFNDRADYAAMMVIVAMLMDGLDGRVARALNVQSEFGKELDSLSDVISFGVAPAFVMYVAAFQTVNPAAAWVATAIFPICGALRLARFNVQSPHLGYFVGLPIPAAGGVLATLALFHNELSVAFLLVSELILSFLMISTVKYPSYKKAGIPKSAKWVLPIIVVGAVIVAIRYPGTLSKLVFVPLVLYALYGIKKNVRIARRRSRRAKMEEQEARETF